MKRQITALQSRGLSKTKSPNAVRSVLCFVGGRVGQALACCRRSSLRSALLLRPRLPPGCPQFAFESSLADKQNRPRTRPGLICLLWAGEDSNLHVLRHQLLRLARLPISPPAHPSCEPKHNNVHPVGVEPTTNSLRGSCSAS